MLFPGLAALSNLHPLFVHFPIAFFLGALMMEGIAIFRGERFHLAATWMCYFGAVTAIITVLTGFIAEYSLAATDPRGHDSPAHNHIHIHRNFMIASTLLGVFLALYLFWINYKEKWVLHRIRFFIGLVFLSLLISLGADRGARLVYEFGAGVNPKVLKEIPHEEHEEGNHH